MKILLTFATALILFSCSFDAAISVQVKDSDTGQPIDSVQVFVSRTDRTHRNFGGFSSYTDSAGKARFVLTSTELENYRHTIIAYKEGMFQTQGSTVELFKERIKKSMDFDLSLSRTENDFHKQLQKGSHLIDTSSIDN